MIFTPQQVLDLEMQILEIQDRVASFRRGGALPEVPRDLLGTLHVNAAGLHENLGRMLDTLEKKHGFDRK